MILRRHKTPKNEQLERPLKFIYSPPEPDTAPAKPTTIRMIKKQKGFSIFTILFLLAVMVFGLIGHSIYKKSEEKAAKIKQVQEINQARTTIKATMVKYQDALQLAASTSRIALSGPVAAMQALKREADLIAVPMCMSNSKEFLIQGMNASIQHFLDFMQQKSSGTEQEESAANIKAYFDNARTAQDLCNNLL